MKTITLAFSILIASTVLSSCSVTSTTYEPGYTYTTYNVGYSYPTYGYYPGYRRYYYDSDFYVRDRVFYGPGFRRGYYRAW